MRVTERFVLVGVIVLLLVGIGAAVAVSYSGPSPSDARKQAVENRADNFNRAAAMIPDPHNTNFPLRRALRKMNDREDLLHHPWYVYILGQNGNTIGYYVASSVPENACNFLSSTEDVYKDGDGNLKMQSPSYDGVYYGSSTCDAWFFFDAATNAEIQIRGVNFYTSDQPLRLDAKAIKVSTSK